MTKQSRRVRVAQIGCGYWGPNILRNLAALPGFELKWVAEASEERRAFVEENFPGVGVTADWRQIIDDKDIEAVVIATPAATHFELAHAAMSAGKHTFVEKPLTSSLADAQKLVELASSRENLLMVGHTFLFHPAVRYVKKLVSSGELGRVFYFHSERRNLGQVRNDVNCWWNLAPHDVSILLYLMDGKLPRQITALGVDYLQKGVEDVAFAGLTWEDGTMAHIHVSWLDPAKIREMTVVGSKKMVVYDDCRDDKIMIYDKTVERIPISGENMFFDRPGAHRFVPRSGDILIPKLNLEEPLRAELKHFRDCIAEDQEPLTGPESALDVVAVLEYGDLALKRRAGVEIPTHEQLIAPSSKKKLAA